MRPRPVASVAESVVLLLTVAVGAVALMGTAGAAQEAELRGTVTLRNGTAYTGLIRMARLGVSPEVTDGVGMDFTNLGSLSLLVGTQKTLIPAGDIRRVEVTWQQTADATVGGWEIGSVVVTKTDGSQVTGRPAWFLGCSYLRVDTQDQGTVKIAAFPTTKDFDPGQLIASIELKAPGAPEQPPAEEVPPPLVAETPPATEAPAATVETTPAGAPVTPAEVAVKPAGPTPAMVTITITCPHCGTPITVTIPATAQ